MSCSGVKSGLGFLIQLAQKQANMEGKKFTISLLLSVSFAFGICAGSMAEEKSAEKCAECHANTNAFKEWQNSRHANSLKTIQKEPKSGTICIKCHSSDYIRYSQLSGTWGVKAELPTPKTAKNAVSCSSCHKHGSKLERNLIMPVDQLCISCHTYYCG